MRYARKFIKHPRQLQLDLTVTLPGLFDLENMYELQKDLRIPLLLKKVFSFSADNYNSPLFLPRLLLNKIVKKVKNKYTILLILRFSGFFVIKTPPKVEDISMKSREIIIFEQIRG